MGKVLNIKKSLSPIVHLLLLLLLPFQQAYLTNYSTYKHETLHSYVVPLWVVHRHVKDFVNNVASSCKINKNSLSHVLLMDHTILYLTNESPAKCAILYDSVIYTALVSLLIGVIVNIVHVPPKNCPPPPDIIH